MKTYLLDATLVNPHSRVNGVNVTVENGKIVEMSQAAIKPEKGSLQMNAAGLILCPGLIDIHFHGALGKDTMDGDLQTLQSLSHYCASHGVTAFYPTTWAASREDILHAILNVKQNAEKMKGARILGVHIEGPYISVEKRGAQLITMIRTPQKDEYRQWFDSSVVKIITCAPEIEGAGEFIQAAIARGIRISIGHSAASYDQVVKAADMGATQATHLFNGMVGLSHREPGTAGGVLADDRIHAQLICDGVHIHPAVVKITIRAKTTDRVILITDSIRGAGLPDGDYDDKGQKFSVRSGIARTPEGGLSGSTLTLETAVQNVMRFTGMPFEDVLPMATSVPALEMGIGDRKGKIEAGYDADLVLLNQEYQVEQTMVNGNFVYQNH